MQQARIISVTMLIDDVERLIHEAPGLTATALAQRLFGHDGYHSRVSTECRVLAHVKRVERRGGGGPGDPFTYYPIAKQSLP
jgi:hypothetical protein